MNASFWSFQGCFFVQAHFPCCCGRPCLFASRHFLICHCFLQEGDFDPQCRFPFRVKQIKLCLVLFLSLGLLPPHFPSTTNHQSPPHHLFRPLFLDTPTYVLTLTQSTRYQLHHASHRTGPQCERPHKQSLQSVGGPQAAEQRTWRQTRSSCIDTWSYEYVENDHRARRYCSTYIRCFPSAQHPTRISASCGCCLSHVDRLHSFKHLSTHSHSPSSPINIFGVADSMEGAQCTGIWSRFTVSHGNESSRIRIHPSFSPFPVGQVFLHDSCIPSAVPALD